MNYIECLDIAATKLGKDELAIDIKFAFEDKHYELMQTAAELYAHLSNSHKHGVSGKRPNCPKCGMPSHPVLGYMCASDECPGKAACASGAVDKTVRGGWLVDDGNGNKIKPGQA